MLIYSVDVNALQMRTLKITRGYGSKNDETLLAYNMFLGHPV